MEKDALGKTRFSNSLPLIAILLAFVLVLVFIWLWYDVKMAALNKQETTVTNPVR